MSNLNHMPGKMITSKLYEDAIKLKELKKSMNIGHEEMEKMCDTVKFTGITWFWGVDHGIIAQCQGTMVSG